MIYRISLILMMVTSLFPDSVTITGTVHNPAGKPVKKAIITLRDMKDEVQMEEKTNRKGKFILEDVEPDFYFLVVEHEGDGLRRIKLNPKKTRNIDLVLQLELTGKDEPVISYLFANKNPTDFDPILEVKDLQVLPSIQHLSITWKDINQATSYVLYEDEIEIYRGKEARFEKDISPGRAYCYTIEALGGFGLKGELSDPVCESSTTSIPRDIKIDVSKNILSLIWSPVEGALSYIIYRNDEKIENTDLISFTDTDLDFGTEYFYKISALDALDKESHPSIEVKGTTREFVASPILSSMKKDNQIMLIWNEVSQAKSYNIYREGDFVTFSQSNSFSDSMPPGEKHCYEVTTIDEFGIESDKSNIHCSKVAITQPTGVTASGDVTSMHLNWNLVEGAVYYKVYEKIDKDSLFFIEKVRSNQFTVRNMEYGIDKCYQISALDGDGEESELSSPTCNVVLSAPHFSIEKMTLLEPSGNKSIDARESGSLQFTLFNDGQSPVHHVMCSIISLNENKNLIIGKPFILDTLAAGRIEFVEISIEGALKLETGENEFEFHLYSNEKIELDEPYLFKVESKSAIPPQLIISDFAVSTDFGTNYIPKDGATVTLSVRVQNVGEGATEFAEVQLVENRSYKTPDFTGKISLPSFNPGDYYDIEIPFQAHQENIAVDFILTDYLDNSTSHRLNLEVMKHYRSPKDLTLQLIGTEDVVHYPDKLGEIDVDHRIPFGRKNLNAMAIVLATEHYEDSNYPDLEYAGRDGDVVRRYFNNAFGLSDFQLLPAKTWQMDGGPTTNDFRNVFDPHQGDLRKRILSADKYSGVEEMDIFLYYRGYGEWVDGKPLLIPKNAKITRNITKYPLEQLVKNLSLLSVLGNIKTITLFLDITYTNPKKSTGSNWDFPDLSEKICILSAASNGETSQVYGEKKHSLFTYALLKGFAGSADDGDSVLELGELTEYVYKVVPEYSRTLSNATRQNPSFFGMDLKRTILDLR